MEVKKIIKVIILQEIYDLCLSLQSTILPHIFEMPNISNNENPCILIEDTGF